MRKAIIILAVVLAAAGNILACSWMAGESSGSCMSFSRNAGVALGDTWGLPVSVGGVSRYNSDCHPSLTADRRLMAFCAAAQNGPPYDTLHIGGIGFNVYTARWNGTTWDSVRNVGRQINPATYPTISSDGDSLFVYKGNKLWLSTWQGNGWSNPVRLPYPVNDPSMTVQDGPCAITLDGHQLYFKSTRTGGYGQGDIWVVRITPTGFDSLTNCGTNVNSAGQETHPAISPDKQRLYFSDFGGQRPGWKYGDCDVFVSHWNGSGWGPAEILQAPVNTDLPACSAFESTDGRLYLGSEVSEGTYGEEDVWVCTPDSTPKEGERPGSGSKGWQNTGELLNATYVYDLIETGGAIYAATAPNGDVFKTTNGGASWANTSDIPGETHIYCLLPARDGSILAGTYPNGKVFRTTDGGASWSQAAQFAYAHAVRKVFQKADGTLFAGTSPDSFGFGRVWRSTDNGANWVRTGNVPQVAGGMFCFYETSGGGLLAGARNMGDRFYVTLNNGNTWTLQNLPYVDSTVTLAQLYFFYRTSDNRLWTGGWAHGPQGILLRSTNEGINWDTCGVIPNGSMKAGRVFDMAEAQDGSYFIGFHPGPDSVVFRSTDGGLTWRNCGSLAGAYEALSLLKASDGSIYAGTTPNGDVFKNSASGVEAEKKALWNVSATLLQNEPNPFHYATSIRYFLPRREPVSLRVYDALGREVATLAEGTLEAGNHAAILESKNLVSGMYFYQLRTGNSVLTKKLLVVR